LLQIIFANVTNQEKTPITLEGVSAPLEVTFTYTVKWHKTEYVFVYVFFMFLFGMKWWLGRMLLAVEILGIRVLAGHCWLFTNVCLSDQAV